MKTEVQYKNTLLERIREMADLKGDTAENRMKIIRMYARDRSEDAKPQ